jgi:phospholipase C
MVPRRAWRLVAGLAASALVLLAAAPHAPLGSAPARAQTAGTPTTPIDHVVFVMKENRSFDSYFGRLPGVDGATSATCKAADGTTTTIDPLPRTPDPLPQDVAHANPTFYLANDGGAMDRFCREKGAIVKLTGQDLADTQMRRAQIPSYWKYAKTYGIGDAMFASWRGASFANNVFEVAGQTGRYSTVLNRRAIMGNANSNGPGFYHWGCDLPAGSTVVMLGLNGNHSLVYPCFDFPALPNVLDTYGVSWRQYANEGEAQFLHVGLDAIRPVRCHDGSTAEPCPPNSYWSDHVQPASVFFDDVTAGTLASVSWIVPKETEHPPKTACAGENATVNIVNAIMQSPYWDSTAIVTTWDEWGGFYDHVPPPTAAGMNQLISYGFRVPLLVISPWTRVGTLSGGGYVSHDFSSHVSMLRFVEALWGLPTLQAADDPSTYQAGEPVPGDLMDFFDFSGASPPKPGVMLRTTRACTPLTPAERRIVETNDPD